MLQQDERVVVATEHRDDALALLGRAMPGLTVRAEGGDEPLAVRWTAVRAGGMQLSELRVRGAASATGAPASGVVTAGVVLSGRYDAEYARHRLDTTRPFLQPAEPVALRLRDAHVRLVEFDADRFRAAAERAGDRGGRRLRLLRTRPVSDDAADAWRWTAASLHDALVVAASANPVLRDELFELGVRMLLGTFGEVVTQAAAADVRAAPAAVRRAVAFLEEHAAGTVTVPEVAAAARVSPRSLQALFRRHLGVTPLAHLHAIRLDAARRDLLAGGAAVGTVHEIAERWGFGNSGRFARLYAERFGERPSDTLRLG
ncbi:helix-turn-helix transcriptional regulator [Amnibacterium endophyticum]|uniref:Helix-turn-helix transcriptional regulator n=1 Tax=Amnibacterium endophyticum TaxID=2109337 RepID=A0ABW4LDL3_9MICO